MNAPALALRALDELPSVGVSIWRLDGDDLVFVHANRAANVLIGGRFPKEPGATMRALFPSTPPERHAAYLNVARTGTPRRLGEIDFDGSTLAVSAVALEDAHVAVYFENLTRQRASESEARRLHAFLDAVIENIPAMVFVKDASHLRFELFNRAGEELLGVKRDELIGKNDYDFFPKEQADFFTSRDREVLDKCQLLDIHEEPIATKNGQRWLHTRKIPILHDGKPRYLLGVSVDITERKAAQDELRNAHTELEKRMVERTRELRSAEEQLLHAQKMEAVGRLAGGVAHDFNNLLSVVLSYSSMILGELNGNDPLREDVLEIKRAGERAADLTRQLLAFSRQQVLQPRTIDLNSIVGGMDRMLKRLLGEDIELTMILSPGLWKLLADPGQIEQVVMNLVVNARDAMPKGGKLTIQTNNVELDAAYAAEHMSVTAGSHVMLAVSDTGHGMDRDTVKRIFEPFFTTKEKGKGTGLGLSTAFGIVNQSGGHIWVYSEIGVGTTFKLYFPRTDVAEKRVDTPMPTTSANGNETILLVEDEDAVRAIAMHVLRRSGYHVLAARSPGEALFIAEQQKTKIHLLLSDVVLPRASGPELATRLLVTRPEMKVLFMSGYPGEAVVQHGLIDSKIAFLQKPLTPELLIRKVREVLSGTEPRTLSNT